MTTRILVATDLSEPSDEAVRQAHARAQSSGAALAVCHVLPAPGWIRSLLPIADLRGPADLHEDDALAMEALRRNIARIVPRATPECFIERGRDYAQIVRRAEAWKADLIVVGSRGATGLARLLLGSVAEGVVRHAHCNVLVAREVGAHGIVVAASDLSDASMPAVTAGAAEARRMKARLSVVHALDFTPVGFVAAASGPFGAGPVMPSTETLQAVHEAVERTLRDALTNLAVEGETTILDGSPAATIANHVSKLGAELLVVGTHGRTGLSRMALGSVAARALRLAPCSVLVVRMTDARRLAHP